MGEEAALTGSGNGRSPGEIRARIEQTRAELTETVNVLKERLSPGHLKKQMIGKVRSATVGRARKMMETSAEKAKEVGSIVTETAQKNPVTKAILDHPIPAVLAGIGIAWLIWRKTGKSDGRAEASTEAGSAAREYPGPAGKTAAETAETAGSRAEEIAGQSRERSGKAAGQAREKAGQVREKAGQVFEQAREKAAQLGTATKEKARVLKDRSRGLLQDRPFLMAAAAVGAGLVIGFVLPATERERKWLGRIRDQLLSRTKEFAEEKLGRQEGLAGDQPWSSGGGEASGLNL